MTLYQGGGIRKISTSFSMPFRRFRTLSGRSISIFLCFSLPSVSRCLIRATLLLAPATSLSVSVTHSPFSHLLAAMLAARVRNNSRNHQTFSRLFLSGIYAAYRGFPLSHFPTFDICIFRFLEAESFNIIYIIYNIYNINSIISIYFLLYLLIHPS